MNQILKERNATIKKGKMNRKVAKTAVSIPQIVKVSSSKRETGKGKEESQQKTPGYKLKPSKILTTRQC